LEAPAAWYTPPKQWQGDHERANLQLKSPARKLTMAVLVMVGPASENAIELAVSDPSEFRSLRQWLARVPGIDVAQKAAEPMHGELGAVEILTILGSGSGALAVAVRTLPEFIRSRRSDVTITAKVKGEEFTLRASNVADVNAVISKLTDG
jgi:membrane-associated two-gene conflict system component 1 (EACC1)